MYAVVLQERGMFFTSLNLLFKFMQDHELYNTELIKSRN